MLRILITSRYDSPNIYTSSIVDFLRGRCEVTCDVESFWKSSADFDIVHIQWPEELFGWEVNGDEQIVSLENRLLHWKNKGTKIVLTRHNAYPHRGNATDRKLYDIVYRYVDGVVHLGRFSAETFDRKGIVNAVIEHPNYIQLIGDEKQADARKRLQISNNAKVFLAFGSIRKKTEEQQIIDAFIKIRKNGEMLYICNSLLKRSKPAFKKDPFERLAYERRMKRFSRNGIQLESRRIPGDEVAGYFTAADVVISPRVDSLNSGVIYLGYSFSKVVVGPAIGNMKYLLETNGNPVFTPLDTNSIANALRQASELVHSDVPQKNFRYAAVECDPAKIADQHFGLYKRLADRDADK